MSTRKNPTRTLHGPTVQYSNGKVVPARPVNIEQILRQFEHLDADGRSAFLCIIAHDLTVAIRSIVFDPPVTEVEIERLKWINESLHRLTSCVNPQKRWSARDEAALIRGIIDNSFAHGFDTWVGRAVAVAAGSTIGSKKSVMAE